MRTLLLVLLLFGAVLGVADPVAADPGNVGCSAGADTDEGTVTFGCGITRCTVGGPELFFCAV